MSSAQQKILRQAPRLLSYHTPTGQKGVIPDTQLAREWAVKKRGADRLGCLSFCYVSPGSQISDHRFGDFYCIISHEHREYRLHYGNTQESEIPIVDLSLRTTALFSFIFNVSLLNCRCIYLERLSFGIFIPSCAFGMEEGANYLDDLYSEAAALLSKHGRAFGLDVYYPPAVSVDNTRLPDGKFAIPFLFDEISKFRTPIEYLAENPRIAPNVQFKSKIDPTVLADIEQKAVHRWHNRRKRAWTLQRPEPNYLTNIERVDFCNPIYLSSAQKCARKIIEWITQKDLTVFRQRDVERSVKQRLHGLSGDGGGIADALRILVAAHYICECHLPSTEYLCKRSSPWFLVNPLLLDRI